MLLAFAHGNLSSSPFKSLTITTAVGNLGTMGSTTRKATAGHLSPKPESHFNVNDEAGFVALLPAEDRGVLQGHPSHVFIHPSYFIHCDGPKTVRASCLALAIMNQLQEQREAEPNDADAQAEVAKEMTALGSAPKGQSTVLRLLPLAAGSGLPMFAGSGRFALCLRRLLVLRIGCLFKNCGSGGAKPAWGGASA
jgi:hypothetical protein